MGIEANPRRTAILGVMGFNPHEKFRARPIDYALMAVASLAALGLVIWAFFA
jgi:hypothetical protein